METVEKIREILHHYLEHLEEHTEEMLKLAEKLEGDKESQSFKGAIEEAVRKIKEAISLLKPFI